MPLLAKFSVDDYVTDKAKEGYVAVELYNQVNLARVLGSDAFSYRGVPTRAWVERFHNKFWAVVEYIGTYTDLALVGILPMNTSSLLLDGDTSPYLNEYPTYRFHFISENWVVASSDDPDHQRYMLTHSSGLRILIDRSSDASLLIDDPELGFKLLADNSHTELTSTKQLTVSSDQQLTVNSDTKLILKSGVSKLELSNSGINMTAITFNADMP